MEFGLAKDIVEAVHGDIVYLGEKSTRHHKRLKTCNLKMDSRVQLTDEEMKVCSILH